MAIIINNLTLSVLTNNFLIATYKNKNVNKERSSDITNSAKRTLENFSKFYVDSSTNFLTPFPNQFNTTNSIRQVISADAKFAILNNYHNTVDSFVVQVVLNSAGIKSRHVAGKNLKIRHHQTVTKYANSLIRDPNDFFDPNYRRIKGTVTSTNA